LIDGRIGQRVWHPKKHATRLGQHGAVEQLDRSDRVDGAISLAEITDLSS